MQVVGERHLPVWQGVEDKSQTRSWKRAALLARLLRAWLRLPWVYWRLPRHDVLLMLYPGYIDVLLLAFLARRRGAAVVWDCFLPLYGTVVEDRRLLAPESWGARFCHWLEGAACRAADRVFMDTAAQARQLERRHGLPEGQVGRVFVGVEDSFAVPEASLEGAEANSPNSEGEDKFTVFFYGQFIPLHGLDTILDAARLLQSPHQAASQASGSHASPPAIQFHLAGTGQEAARIDARIAQEGLTSIRRSQWIPYAALPQAILNAHCCLGIFGTSAKALAVIPNKVFQVLALGVPLITADTPAIRELLPEPPAHVRLVPPGDAQALAQAIALALADMARHDRRRRRFAPMRVGPESIAGQLYGELEAAMRRAA